MKRSQKILAFNVIAVGFFILAASLWSIEVFTPTHFSISTKDVKGLSLGGIQVGQTVEEIRQNLKPGWMLEGHRILGEGIYIYIKFDEERKPKTVKEISSSPSAGLCYDQYLILPRKDMPSLNLFLKEDLKLRPSEEDNYTQVYIDPKDNREVILSIFHGNVREISLK